MDEVYLKLKVPRNVHAKARSLAVENNCTMGQVYQALIIDVILSWQAESLNLTVRDYLKSLEPVSPGSAGRVFPEPPF